MHANPQASAAPPSEVDELRARRSLLLLVTAVSAPLAALAWGLPALLPAALRDLARGASLALPPVLLLSALDLARERRRVQAPGAPPAAEGPGVARVIRLHPLEAPLAPGHDGDARFRTDARARRR